MMSRVTLFAAAASLLAMPSVVIAQSCGSTVRTLSVEQSISIIEVTHDSDSLLLFGVDTVADTLTRRAGAKPAIVAPASAKRTGAKRRVTRQFSSEVDPRSQLMIRFNRTAGDCAPPFTVRLHGKVHARNSSRALEIPYYFEAGKEQPAPEPRGQLFARAATLLINSRFEIERRLKVAGNERVNVDPGGNANPQLVEMVAEISQISKEAQQLYTKQSDALYRWSDTSPQTRSGAIALFSDSISKITLKLEASKRALDKKLDSISAAPVPAVAARNLDALRRAIRHLSEPSPFHHALELLATDKAASLRREIAALQKTDPNLMRRQLQLALEEIKAAEAAAGSKDATAETLRLAFDRLKTTFEEFNNFLARLGTLDGMTDRLELPNVLISLASSSASEGERVVLNVDFVAEDQSVLSSGTLSLQVRRLGKAVSNVRDVAYFVTRCDNACTGTRRSPSQLAVAQALRDALKAAPANDRIAYENAARYSDIPNIERGSPAPGIAFEALIRPRIKGSGLSTTIASIVRPLGLSFGASASLLQFTDSRVQIEAPTWSNLQTALASGAKLDTLVRVQTVTDQKGKLGIAGAIHIGLFEGAISGAYGYNFAVKDSPRFYAIGLSFMALTDAGQQLMAKFGSGSGK
jgi:hypothetical protein